MKSGLPYRTIGIFAICGLLLTAVLAGCGGSAAAPAAAPVATLKSIAITPSSSSIPRGGTQQFTAMGSFSDNSTKDVTLTCAWNSSNTAVVTVSSAGLATALSNATVGQSAMITCSQSGVSATTPATATVAAASLTSVTVTGASSVDVGATTPAFAATGHFSDGTTQTLTSSTTPAVTWSSSNTTNATVDSSGVATGKHSGTANIIATSGSISGSASLTVVAVLTSISITPSPAVSIAQGATQNFTATGHFNDGTSSDITTSATWNSDNTAVATISNNAGSQGKATGVSVGTANIAATKDAVTSPATLLTVTAAASCATPNNNANFSGHYAFLFQGWTSGTGPVMQAAVGSFVADGAGNVTNGLIDTNDPVNGPKSGGFAGGTYCIGTNNLGTMTLDIGTFDIVLQSSGNGNFIETDTSAQGSGILRKQDTTAFATSKIAGNYALGFVGVDSVGGRFASAGTFHSDGAGTLSNGVVDVNDAGTVNNATFSSNNFAVANTGRATATVTVTGVGNLNLVFYVVSASELVSMQTDSVAGGSTLQSGQVLQQTGTFTNASLSGNAVFGIEELSGGTTPSVEAGVVTLDGSGNFNFTSDQNKGGTLNPQTGSGTYSVSSNGRVTITAGSQPPIFYLVAQNTAFFLGGGGEVEFGMLEPQSAGPFSNASLSGTYAGGSRQPVNANVSDELDVVSADGVSTINVTDDNNGNQKTLALSYAVAANGRVTVTQGATPEGILYLVSPTKAVLVPPDTNPKLSVFQK